MYHGLRYRHNMVWVLIFFYILVGLVHNTLPSFKIYVMELKGFLGYLRQGIASALNNFRHE